MRTIKEIWLSTPTATDHTADALGFSYGGIVGNRKDDEICTRMICKERKKPLKVQLTADPLGCFSALKKISLNIEKQNISYEFKTSHIDLVDISEIAEDLSRQVPALIIREKTKKKAKPKIHGILIHKSVMRKAQLIGAFQDMYPGMLSRMNREELVEVFKNSYPGNLVRWDESKEFGIIDLPTDSPSHIRDAINWVKKVIYARIERDGDVVISVSQLRV